MAVIAPTITVMNDATLKIAANNYETSVNSVLLTPTTPKSKFKGIGGNSIASIGAPDWTCTIGYLQDWDTTNALSRYLLANKGTSVAAEFYPKNGGKGFAVTLVIEPGPIGGDADAQLLASVTLEVSGQPSDLPIIP